MANYYCVMDGGEILHKFHAHEIKIDPTNGGVSFYIGDKLSAYVPSNYIVLQINDPNKQKEE